MSEVNISVKDYEKLDGSTLVCFDGTIDTHTVPQVEEKFSEIIQDGKTKLVLDCTDLKFISSAGLGSIMATYEDIEDADENGYLKIINLSEDIFEVFSMMGFADLLEIYKNEEELLSS